MLELLVETIVGALLVATCAYCYILSRKLRTLREGQAELLSVISKFDEASRRAEENLSTMQATGANLNRNLAAATARANALVDELSVMVHAGDRIAGRIEGAVSQARAMDLKAPANDARAAS